MAELLRKIGNSLSITARTPRIYFGRDGRLPGERILVPFSREIVASYSGPNGGLTNSGPVLANSGLEQDHVTGEDTGNARDENWGLRNDGAYGKSLSLYEYTNSRQTDCAGDPIADVFAVRATSNSCIMAVADGVGWSQGARRAAQCAVKASMEYMWSTLYHEYIQTEPVSTMHVFQRMHESLDKAQDLIISQDGSMTTLCLAVVADVLSPGGAPRKAVCVVNVGDSLAFVYSRRQGVREVTFGCREYNLHRDMRFCNGALGPCLGENYPDFGNLTFSLTTIDEGDIVFLTSDGVSDNFDPVIAGRAVASSDGHPQLESGHQDDVIPALTPLERQENMTRSMERVIRETELPNEGALTAEGLCGKLLHHAVVLTVDKRAAYEAANNIISLCENECLETQNMTIAREALMRQASGLRGKLDHATVVAYVAGPSARVAHE